jgi:hypothetical protein
MRIIDTKTHEIVGVVALSRTDSPAVRAPLRGMMTSAL